MKEKELTSIYSGIIVVICIIGGLWLVTIHSSDLQQTPQSGDTKTIPSTILNQRIPAQNLSVSLQSSIGMFSIEAKVPETPRYIRLYKGLLSQDDLERHFKFRAPNRYLPKNSTPSESEAPAIAEKALDAYGGLPSDAVLSLVYISESVTESSSGEIIKRSPMMTQVFYSRQIDELPVVGEESDEVVVDLGEGGEVLVVMKRWRTLEKTGEVVEVIPAEKAVEKLKRGESLIKLQSLKTAHIDDVRLGYYEKPGKIRETILEPVWIFKSTTEQGYEFPVYARQFAGFNQTTAVTTKSVVGKTISEKDPFTATFTDTSDANPIKWQWDFGDGITSTEQNPTHTYKAAGTYNVTLMVWNEMGSDTITRQYVVEDKSA
jgi:hypothetical protein